MVGQGSLDVPVSRLLKIQVTESTDVVKSGRRFYSGTVMAGIFLQY